MQRTENIHALSAGTRLRDYRLERVLGSGGFGITYRAREEITERSVAIKEYLPSALAARDRDGSTVRPISENTRPDYEWGLKRFREEAKLLIGLKHPNIIAVLSYFEANGTGYLVMEFQDGSSLGELLRERKTLPEPELTALVLPLLDGVEAVHAHGFLHRDIKPDNIFIRRGGTPVLLDFGAARQGLGQHTRSLTAILTEGYAPYEQYERDGRQGPWTDIHAIGAVMFRCLLGERPIDAPKRVTARMREEPDPLAPDFARLAEQFSRPISSAIRSAMGVTERDRPQTVREFRDIVQGKSPATKFSAPVSAHTLTPDLAAEPSASTIVPAAAETPLAQTPSAQASPAMTRSARWPLYAGVAALLVTGSAAAAYFALDAGPSAPDKSAAATRTTPTPVSADADELKRRSNEARRRAEDDARKKADEEAARRRAEEERSREEAKRKADEEAARKRAEEEAERKTQEEAARRRAEEDRKRLDEDRAREEAKKRADEDAKRRADEEAKRRAEDERRKAEERRSDSDDDAKRKAEEESRRKADADAKQKQLAIGTSWYAPERRQGALFFAYKKAVLEPGALAALERLAGSLAARPDARIVLVASADGSEGTQAEQQALSRARIAAVQQWLAGKGIAATRLRTNAIGSRGQGPEFRVIAVSLDERESASGRDQAGEQAFRGTWSAMVAAKNPVSIRIDQARGGFLSGTMNGWGTTYTLSQGPPNAVNAQGRYAGNAVTITSAHGTFELQLQGNVLRGLFKSSFSSTYYMGRGGTFTVEFARQ